MYPTWQNDSEDSGEEVGDEDGDGEGDDDDDETGRGYGGIKNQSVDEIIAKARFTESFLSASFSVGLTDDLGQLAKLEGDGEEDENDVDGITTSPPPPLPPIPQYLLAP